MRVGHDRTTTDYITSQPIYLHVLGAITHTTINRVVERHDKLLLEVAIPVTIIKWIRKLAAGALQATPRSRLRTEGLHLSVDLKGGRCRCRRLGRAGTLGAQCGTRSHHHLCVCVYVCVGWGGWGGGEVGGGVSKVG